MPSDDDFFDAVKEMRRSQQRYFRVRTNHNLREAKRCEQEVDELIATRGAVELPFVPRIVDEE